jgi:hypothetical protein
MNYSGYKWNFQYSDESEIFIGYNHEYIKIVIQNESKHSQYEGSFYNDSRYFTTQYIKDILSKIIYSEEDFIIDYHAKVIRFNCKKGFRGHIDLVQVPYFNHPEFIDLNSYLFHNPNLEKYINPDGDSDEEEDEEDEEDDMNDDL